MAGAGDPPPTGMALQRHTTAPHEGASSCRVTVRLCAPVRSKSSNSIKRRYGASRKEATNAGKTDTEGDCTRNRIQRFHSEKMETGP